MDYVVYIYQVYKMRSSSERKAQKKYIEKKKKDGYVWLSFFIPKEVRNDIIREKRKIMDEFRQK